MNELIAPLATLAELYAQRDLLHADLDTHRAKILAPINPQLAELEEEYAPMLEAVNAKIEQAETAAKTAIIASGASQKACGIHVIYTKPRVTWDTPFLDGLCTLIPEIKKARHEGAPSARIDRKL